MLPGSRLKISIIQIPTTLPYQSPFSPLRGLPIQSFEGPPNSALDLRGNCTAGYQKDEDDKPVLQAVQCVVDGPADAILNQKLSTVPVII